MSHLGLMLFAAACAFIALLPLSAPEGWQDADGFHLGRQGDALSHDKDDAR